MGRHGWYGKAGVAIVALCSMMWSAGASAQDVATAEALFRKGLEDMQAGRYKTGCPAIAESLRLDPRPGTLFTLAECEATAGNFATAVARYQDYLEIYARMPPDQQSRQLGREKIAEEKKRALTPLLPKLTIVLPPSAPPGVKVQRDGLELAAPALGIALPVDPGEHTIEATYPNGAHLERKVTLKPSEHVTIELDASPTSPATEPSVTAAVTALPTAAPPAGGAGLDAGMPDRRVLAYVVGGVGIAGIVVGSVAGAFVFEKKGTIERNCTGLDCNRDGKDAADSAKSLATLSTIGFVAGSVALASGVVLLVTERRSQKPARPAPDLRAEIMAGHNAFGLSLSGSW